MAIWPETAEAKGPKGEVEKGGERKGGKVVGGRGNGVDRAEVEEVEKQKQDGQQKGEDEMWKNDLKNTQKYTKSDQIWLVRSKNVRKLLFFGVKYIKQI